MSFDEYQRAIGEWSDRNFLTNTDNEPFHGIVEEVGELVLANVEMQELWGDDENAITDFKDAIADTFIYLVDYCNRRVFRIVNIFEERETMCRDLEELACVARWEPKSRALSAIVIAMGQLAHARLKLKQGIRGDRETHLATERQAIFDILVSLAMICQKRHYNLSEIVEYTWEKVSQRDWTKNPMTGQS